MTDRSTADARRRRDTDRVGAVVLGFALIAAGVLLAAHRLGWVDGVALLGTWWPLVLVAAGVWWAIGGERLGGAIAVLVGGGFLLSSTGVVDVDVGQVVVPAVLIAVGGGLIVVGRRLGEVGGAGTVRAVLSSRQVAGAPTDFADHRAVAVFGEATLRLADSAPSTRPVPLGVVAVFGEVKVCLPPGWRVRDHTSALAGEVTLPDDPPGDPDAPVVELHGVAMFGEIEVSVDDTG